MGFLQRMDRHADLVGSMAETLHVDLAKSMQYGQISPMDLRNAVMSCMGCEADGECQDWLEAHKATGASDTPRYCRNRELLLRLQHA